ncbi:MAG: spore coat associated protein CotJA [Clostridiales bacterium]|jgi:hypothetical protein|nr:spore coat associated protein CotJA [Clostridiales bacterium]
MQEDMFKMMSTEYGIPPLPKNPVVAMAYVPYQGTTGTMYNPEQGLNAGTMFPVLDKPFLGCGGMKR